MNPSQKIFKQVKEEGVSNIAGDILNSFN